MLFRFISTHKGLFRYNRLPFGVSSAPSIFQRVMENLLQGIPGTCVYIDDILVTGKTEQEHLNNLEQALQRLQEAGVRLKRGKCAFLLPSVEYLGHVISAEGLHTSEAKVQAVVGAPAPRNVSELRSFLGLVNYYGKFLPDLASTMAPLYTLLQKGKPWTWGTKQKAAFNQVKQLLQSSQVLVHFDSSLPLILECDASPHGVGAVLSHRMPDGTERPIGFSSRSLAKAEQKYSQLDKEALAIVVGVKKYHQYLFGREFVIRTDHKPLTHIFNVTRATPTMASGRLQRWALTLGAYSYAIEYKAGARNANADALSRLPLPTVVKEVPTVPEVVHLMQHLDSTPVTTSHIRLWTEQDPVLAKVKRWILSGWPNHLGNDIEELRSYKRRRYELSVEEGCVLWGSRVVVPPKGREKVLSMLHEAHPGIAKMKSFARGYVWWPGLDQQLEECVKKCVTCQTTRKAPPVVPLHSWSWPDKPWTRVHIDYAGPMYGKMFFLMIDAHSKWLEVHITRSSTSAATIGLMRSTFATLGLPETIVSDNAANFTSQEFQDFLQRNGVRHVRTPPYHPSSNGQVERAVQTLKEGMKKMTEGTLETRLARFLFKYRLTPHSSTGVSPAELIFGRRPRSQLDLLHPDMSKTVRRSQDRQKQSHDAHARARDFQVDDLVYARNYGSGPPWLPGKVTRKSGEVSYTVLLEDGRQVHKHVDQLRARMANEEADKSAPGTSDSSEEDQELELPEMKPGEPEVSTQPAIESSTDDQQAREDPDRETESGRADAEPSQPEELTDSAESTSPPGDPAGPEQPRRSSRQRTPRDWYGDQHFY